MNLLQRRRAMMGVKAEQGLPDEYQQVEWIGHAKTVSIMIPIPINDIPRKWIRKVVTDISIPSTTSSNPVIWGGLTNSTACTSPYGDMNGTLGVFSCSPTKSEVADLTARTTYTFSTTQTYPGANYGYCIWGWDSSSFNTSIRGYAITIYTDNDEVMFNGVPCYRKSDNANGLYDTVSKKFHPGAGAWTKGADVA